ncbi:MAG: hypothetical protein QXW52_09230 [Candidatus Caldarchaeum sp.]
MPRRYKILYEKAKTLQDKVVDVPVISIPLDDERVFPPVVYGCDRCGRKFYSLKEFADHLTLKHLIPPSQAWRYVKPKEVR